MDNVDRSKYYARSWARRTVRQQSPAWSTCSEGRGPAKVTLLFRGRNARDIAPASNAQGLSWLIRNYRALTASDAVASYAAGIAAWCVDNEEGSFQRLLDRHYPAGVRVLRAKPEVYGRRQVGPRVRLSGASRLFGDEVALEDRANLGAACGEFLEHRIRAVSLLEAHAARERAESVHRGRQGPRRLIALDAQPVLKQR